MVKREDPENDQPAGEQHSTGVRSLKELLDMAAGRNLADTLVYEDMGLAEPVPYPFLAIVGQQEMKLALILSLINPAIGGVLLIGPRGTGKTTAVRSLLDLLPAVERSTCPYGCLPQDVENGGVDAVCPECARKYGQGEPLTRMENVRLVELPLNARLEDVIGGLDERAVTHERYRLKRGILAMADLNVLYVDEVNLLSNEIVDAILDASAAGSYTVRRGPITATYRSRLTLIGTMNPEEGKLRPQILDRFGLRVLVQGLSDPAERFEAYRRVQAYKQAPRAFLNQYADAMPAALEEIENARRLLPEVKISPEAIRLGISVIQQMRIDSLRAEITLFEAARALAAADARQMVETDDIRAVAPLALRLRRSEYITQYFEGQKAEDQEVNSILSSLADQKGETE